MTSTRACKIAMADGTYKIAPGQAAVRPSCTFQHIVYFFKFQIFNLLWCFTLAVSLRCAGALGFYKGMRAKIVQSILAAALLMAVKEQITTSTAALLRKSVIVTTTPTKAAVVQLAELAAASK